LPAVYEGFGGEWFCARRHGEYPVEYAVKLVAGKSYFYAVFCFFDFLIVGPDTLFYPAGVAAYRYYIAVGFCAGKNGKIA